MKKVLILFVTFLSIYLSAFSLKEEAMFYVEEEPIYSFAEYSNELYLCVDASEINAEAFSLALKGYYNLLKKNELSNQKYITIVDMSLSANEERFFVVDIECKQLVFKSLVAHGKKSGEEYAKSFSNNKSSYQTSLGFYKTAETYIGKRGFSLKLDGLEYSNNNARERGIVIHGAKYVSNKFIKENQRLGRSLGCPSLPMDSFKEIIESLKDGSCLFVYSPEKAYLSKSKFVNANDNYLLTNAGLVSE
tara:strand:+ start:6862 stop:7605 length:744 start_codon:yes stop_codon:yes gene_type:complete